MNIYPGLLLRQWLQRIDSQWRRSLHPVGPGASSAWHSRTSTTWWRTSLIILLNGLYYTLKCIKVVRAVFFSVLFQSTIILPNNKTGNHCPHKGISQDGSHVPEKMSLKNKRKHAANFTEVTIVNHKLKLFIKKFEDDVPFSSCSLHEKWWAGEEYWRKPQGQT